MQLNKFNLILVLFVILGVFYAFNIFSANKIISSLTDNSSVTLLFTVIVPDNNQCPKCFDTTALLKSIDTSSKIKISNKKIITSSSLIFGNLIKRYKIKNLPALIISGDISDKRVINIWKSLKGTEEDGNIVIQNMLPFYNLAEQKPKGIVDAILIKDKTCKKCFDESLYLTATKRLGMTIGNSTIYDISSSKGYLLAKKYKITKIPAFLLSTDAEDYPGFGSLWKEVGTKEKDGWFVFREVQKMGKYKNIKF